MPNSNPTLIEIPVILTEVEYCERAPEGFRIKFACLSDALLLGRSYPKGARIQITIVESIHEENYRRYRRSGK